MRQLIFTSALSGLSRGRSGFCTVARSASLRERVVEELEKTSVYEPPEGSRPTVFSFRVCSGGNEPLYVLSRMGDAGTDAFGRPNFVAHHLVFRENEIADLPPPAEVALRFRGWVEKYDGAPALLPDDEPLPPEIRRENVPAVLPAKRWAELSGDAGNAALLCPFGEPRATVFVGDESMTETALGLFAESAATLGENNAWEVAFSTGLRFANDPEKFLWRMLDGDELSARRPGDFILDFLAPLTALRAPKTDFAEFARTGIFRSKKIAAADTADPSEDFSEENSANAPVGKTASEAAPEAVAPARASRKNVLETTQKHISDAAGTLKFLALAALVVAVVLGVALCFSGNGRKNLSPENSAETVAAPENSREDFSAEAARFVSALEKRIELDDFAGAAEIWVAFSETFPNEAAAVAPALLPLFKLKTADAFAEKISRRMLPVDVGGTLSPEEKSLIRAELAMFARVREKLELSDGRIHRKNLEIFERAAAAVADAPAPDAVPAPAQSAN